MNTVKYIPIIFLFFITACRQNEKEERNFTFQYKSRSANENLITADSVKKTIINIIKPNKVVDLGKGTEVSLEANIRDVSSLELIKPFKVEPVIRIIGSDTLLQPAVRAAKGKVRKSGTPEIISSKEPLGREKNTKSISTYKVLQGMKHHNIRCAMQDRKGNLWMATRGGGLIRFDGKNFAHYTEKQGLCSDYVWSLYEDSNGKLWIGSQFGGLDVYDGKTFTNYASDSSGIFNNVIYSINEDKNGNILLGTENGLLFFDGKQFKQISLKQGMPSGVAWTNFIDKKGNIWIGTNLGGLVKYDGEKLYQYIDKDGLLSTIYSIIENPKTCELIVGTDYGVFKFDGETFTSLIENKTKQDISVWSLMYDRNDNLWVSTYNAGVYKINDKTYERITTNEGLMSDLVWDLLQDRSGTIWFASQEGLSRYNGEMFKHFTRNEGLNNPNVNGVAQDDHGNIWLATAGGGLIKYDGVKIRSYESKDGLFTDKPNSLKIDKNGFLWIGSAGDGIGYLKDNKLSIYNEHQTSHIVLSLSLDDRKNIMFGFEGAFSLLRNDTLYSYNKKNGLTNELVHASLRDSKGNIWIGTLNGLSRITKNGTGNFVVNEHVLNDRISTLIEDKQGNIWIGTNSGVAKYDGKEFTYLTENEGLSNNVITSSIVDRDGNIWFGTMNGLSKLLLKNVELKKTNPDLPIFKNYGYEDGFLGSNCRKNSLMQDKDGKIWIGTGDRLTVFDTRFEIADTTSPNIQLTGITLFNQPINWENFDSKPDTTIVLSNGVIIKDFKFDGLSSWYNIPQNLSLAYNSNNISIHYNGISLQQANKIKYKYKLEPLDDNWSTLSNKTEVNYANLPPGSYDFSVKAMNSEGVWSSTFTYHFTIRPPWWQTYWFYSLAIIVSVVSVYSVFRYRVASLRKRQKELELTVSERTAEVVSQKQEIEEHRKEILDSINYAKRIQYALLASDSLLNTNLPEHFVLFKPKDIVSGDFYWATQTPEGFSLIVADCTGHGVPGAFMSLLNISKLSQTINESGIYRPDEVLNNVRKEIIKALNPEGTVEQSKDGMDAVLCKLDLKNLKLEYAAANNSFYIVRQSKTNSLAKELLICKPDKMPVGAGYGDLAPFTYNEIQLQKGDMIYLLTDGYADQFGGEKGKKFKYKQLEELFLSLADQSMLHQKENLDDSFTSWKRDLEQVDDVCILGIRI